MNSVISFFQAFGMSVIKWWIIIAMKVYYRKVKVVGLENIPKDKPIIYAPNHQYAFMDALVVTRFTGKIPYYLVRADFFKSPILNMFLRSLRMMPVYSARNKRGLQNKNEEIFDRCVEILEKRNDLIIFPEGYHSKIKRVRQIKKGILRIAFRTLLEAPESKDLVIIPVGINYDDNSKFQSDWLLRFGEPITVSDYLDAYNENQAKTMDRLRDLIFQKLVSLTINIDSAESYKFYDNMLRVYTRPYCMEKKYKFRKLEVRFQAYKEIINGMDRLSKTDPAGFKDLQPKFNRFYNLLRKNRINTMALEKVKEDRGQRIYKAIILILLWPFYLYGLVNNFLAIIVPAFLGNKAIRDDHFLSSIQIAMGLFSFPLAYFIQGFIVYKISESWLMTGLYILSIILFGLFSQKYRYQFKKSFEILKFRRLLIKKRKDYRYILRTYREIIDYMHKSLIFDQVKTTS